MYDLIIVGGGPAGLTAGIYGGRYKLKTLLISPILGGAALDAEMIENWPGYLMIKGRELIQIMAEQVKKFGVDVKEAEVSRIKKTKKEFSVFVHGEEIKAKKLILALGTQRRRLNLPNEDGYVGKGISYCVHCDAPMFKNKAVAVVGGKNAAAMAAIMLSDYATSVHLIFRKPEIECDPYLAERIKSNKKITLVPNANVAELFGKPFLSGIELDNKKKLDVQGLFVEIGATPSTVLANGLGVKLDKRGFIKVDSEMETNVKGVFAAGDITNSTMLKQITTASGQGAVAAFSAYKSLQEK
jgi:thioredoxin reductase (NADPH)